ncbi:ATP-binding cassette domain-containing protein, partial [Tractidigestivibacter sp.]|uniref:ATP-binding cassette domain-containing protein n=1 Tax=Tractidigestivibacter sp. TaxID=2847320 RepID=UPI003FD7C36B
LKVMTGKLQPTSGTVRIGKSVRFGWMSQHLDTLSKKENWRVLEVLSRYKSTYYVDGKPQSPTQLLERLGFERSELTNFVHDLSGGQRRRLALLTVLLDEPNVLVLDEPGNDLDTDMLAVLEDLLDTWPGTLLMVSHDRFLMERVTDDQYALLDGHVRHCPGGVDEFLDLLDAKGASSSGAEFREAHSAQEDQAPSGGQGGELTNQERRELKKRFDAVTRKLEKTEGEPDRLRAALAEVDPTDYEKLVAAQKAVDDAVAACEALEDEWLELSDKLGIE